MEGEEGGKVGEWIRREEVEEGKEEKGGVRSVDGERRGSRRVGGGVEER